MEKWNGKVAVVTGASSGIGEEIVKTLAKNKLTVIGIARRVEKIQQISDASDAEGKIHGKRCDITQPYQVENVFNEIQQQFGRIDLLVNCAGIFRVTGLIDCPIHDLKDVLDVNIFGMSMCTRKAVQCMRKTGDTGHIININSVCGHQVVYTPSVHTGLYAASKYAVTAFSETLRIELRDKNSNIKVTSISPGSVLTDTISKAGFEMGTNNGDVSKVKGFLRQKDVAEAILYAISVSDGNQINELTLTPMKNL